MEPGQGDTGLEFLRLLLLLFHQDGIAPAMIQAGLYVVS
jgi:hypothetical protein